MEEEVWRTINGVHVLIGADGTIIKGPKRMQGKKAKNINKEEKFDKTIKNDKISTRIKTQRGKEIKNKLNKFKDSKYDDGTYNLETGEKVDFGNKGFNVSFEQSTDNYTPAEYYDKVMECSKKCDGKIYAGKFGGDPEISFYTENLDVAKEIMYKYNQHSIWSNELQDIIKNERYDESKNKTGYKD